MLKWWKVLLGRKPSELLYLSDDRISQVNFPALSGKAATLKEKHARLSKQENAHDKLSSTTRLTRAVIFKKENLSSLKLTNSNFCDIALRLMAAAVLSTEVSKSKDKINWLSSQTILHERKEQACTNNILCKWFRNFFYLRLSACASESKIKRKSCLKMTSKLNVSMLHVVLKTAPASCGLSWANTSKILNVATFLMS